MKDCSGFRRWRDVQRTMFFSLDYYSDYNFLLQKFFLWEDIQARNIMKADYVNLCQYDAVMAEYVCQQIKPWRSELNEIERLFMNNNLASDRSQLHIY
jgi:hypothetical protein